MVASEKGAYYSWTPRGCMGAWISLIDVYVNATAWIVLFSVDCYPIIQLDFSYQLNMAHTAASAGGLSVGTVVDTTTANAVILLPLDNYASSGTEGTQTLIPIGLSTATVNDPQPLSIPSALSTRGGPVVSSSSDQRAMRAGRQ